MNEDNENKGLAWINTPFSLTKLDKQYTLFQQNVLMLTSTHLQKFVDEYFLEKRQLGDARSDFLFEQGVDHAVMNIPPIKIDIHDFITYENMSYQKLRAELKTSILDMAVKSTLPDGSEQVVPMDMLLVLQGLSPQLGPLADWGMAMERKQLVVNTETFATTAPGIFAVGDINTYPGKRKLLVCGFHECTLAAYGAAPIVHPGRPVLLQYTTSSTHLHQLLGVHPTRPTARDN